MEASITLTGDVSNSSLEQLPLVLQKGVQKNLQAVIRQIFENCYAVGAYRQVVGIAIEARNLEVLREAILRASRSNAKNGKQPSDGNAGAGEELLEYVLDICMNIVQERGLRNEVCRGNILTKITAMFDSVRFFVLFWICSTTYRIPITSL